MTKIYGKRHEYSRVAAGDVVDFGVEETLLSRRAGQEQSRSKAAPRSITEGGRRRQQGTLLSLMQMSDGSNRDVAKATSTRPAQKRIRPQKEEEAEDELPSSSSRPVRSTRGRKARSPTPLSLLSFKRYSKDPGLGPPWDQPVVYPETGRKRVTVDFTDLERLDEGEFLNDNLIEFYSRWLQVNRPIKEKTAYFFGTHFYTTVSETPKSEKGTKTLRSNINYKAVERWTAKDDIFDYDFVVVPVNESAHWYLAIICNLPNVQRKLADDGKEVEEVEEASQPDSTKAAKGSESQPVEISELSEGIPATTQAEARPPVVPDSTEIDGEDEGAPVREDARARATKTTPTRGMSQQCHDMKLTSPKPAGAMGTQAASELTQPDEQEDAAAAAAAAAETPDTKLEVAVDKVYDVPDSQPEQIQASQASASVFADAMPPSPEKKRKGKRKSIPRGYDQGQPAIVIIDPMGIGHPRAITVLKDYLIEEARSKRGMEIDRSMFQGLNVNQGIPKQDNYYDCGVFILGYLDKFMSGPEEFGKKLLAKSFDEGADWPEMKSNNMRNTMRVLLQQIAKEQRELRQTKRQEKRAAKKQIAATASSPPGRSNENPVDLSSPSQPRAEGKDTRAVDDRSSEQRSPSKGSRAPKVPSKVARIPEDDEMILQPHHKPTDQHQPAAEDVEMSQGQERTHISDSDSGDEREVVKPGSKFDIWQDEALASTETRSLVRKSPERSNVQYKIDLEL
jgi:sentrin-specific protease 7